MSDPPRAAPGPVSGPAPPRAPHRTARGRTGRRFTVEEIHDLVVGAGFVSVTTTAVRVFADLVPGSLLDSEPGAASALVELERAVAGRAEYLPLAAQVHLLAG